LQESGIKAENNHGPGGKDEKQLATPEGIFAY